MISRKNYKRVANLLYWKDHYAPITSIPSLFSDITKHTHQKYFCLRCFGHFSFEQVLTPHKELCTRDDFMSVLHVLPTPGSKQAQIKFFNYKFCTMAPFVIYMRTPSPSLSRSVDRWIRQLIPSSTKCALRRPFSDRLLGNTTS